MDNHDFIENYKTVKLRIPKSPSAVIFGIFILIYFFATFAGIIIFAKKNVAIMLLLLGQMFLVLGIIVFIHDNNKRKNLKLLIVPLIGACIMIAGIFILLGNQATVENLTPLLLLIVFFFAGLSVIVSSAIKEQKAKTSCTIKLEAVVADLKRSTTQSNSYSPVYEYKFQERIYQQYTDVYANVGVPKIGNKKTIYINPNDPTKIYAKNYAETILIIIVSLLFMLISLIGLISIIPTFL